MTDNVWTATYTDLPVNYREVARYAGCTVDTLPERTEALIRETGSVNGKVCWVIRPLTTAGNELCFSGIRTGSEDLKKCLQGCDRVILFAATAGFGVDRLIQKYERISPASALLLQAYGAERAEAVCDAFNRDMALRYGKLRPRYSPGYGDLPLELQKDIFTVLRPYEHIGITLNDSMLMLPSKSVTAIIGIPKE